jgi:hypothetical protein
MTKFFFHGIEVDLTRTTTARGLDASRWRGPSARRPRSASCSISRRAPRTNALTRFLLGCATSWRGFDPASPTRGSRKQSDERSAPRRMRSTGSPRVVRSRTSSGRPATKHRPRILRRSPDPMPRRPLRGPLLLPPPEPAPAWLMPCARCRRLVDRILGGLATEADRLCRCCAFQLMSRETFRRARSLNQTNKM